MLDCACEITLLLLKPKVILFKVFFFFYESENEQGRVCKLQKDSQTFTIRLARPTFELNKAIIISVVSTKFLGRVFFYAWGNFWGSFVSVLCI